MKRKLVLITSILLWLGLFNACSSDDVGLVTKEAQTSIIGKWKLVRNGDFEIDSSTVFVEFCENGIVRYEMGVGKDNYRLIESQLEFEDDWAYSYENDQVKGIYGHIHFMMYGSGQNLNEPNRFFCHIIGNTELHLVPAEGNMYIMDPTMYYIKVIRTTLL